MGALRDLFTGQTDFGLGDNNYMAVSALLASLGQGFGQMYTPQGQSNPGALGQAGLGFIQTLNNLKQQQEQSQYRRDRLTQRDDKYGARLKLSEEQALGELEDSRNQEQAVRAGGYDKEWPSDPVLQRKLYERYVIPEPEEEKDETITGIHREDGRSFGYKNGILVEIPHAEGLDYPQESVPTPKTKNWSRVPGKLGPNGEDVYFDPETRTQHLVASPEGTTVTSGSSGRKVKDPLAYAPQYIESLREGVSRDLTDEERVILEEKAAGPQGTLELTPQEQKALQTDKISETEPLSVEQAFHEVVPRLRELETLLDRAGDKLDAQDRASIDAALQEGMPVEQILAIIEPILGTMMMGNPQDFGTPSELTRKMQRIDE